jgi:conserved oligomeric Golgi complex subunit 6
VKTRLSIVDLFLARFTLSADESDALYSPEVPIGPTFFAAMDRAQAIREDCRVLMAGEDSPSKAGCVPSLHDARLNPRNVYPLRWIDSTSWP